MTYLDSAKLKRALNLSKWDGLFVAICALGLGLYLTGLAATNPDFGPTSIVDVMMLFLCAFVFSKLPTSSTPRNRFDRLGLFLMAILFFVTVLSYGLAWRQEYFAAGKKCLMFPSLFPKLECFLSLDFRQNYGLRQLLTHLSVFVLFCTSYKVAQQPSAKNWWRFLFIPMVIFGVYCFFTATGLFEFRLMPENFVGGDGYSLRRGAGLMSNVGWVWLLLSVGLSFLLGLAATTKDRLKWAYLAVALAFSYGMIATGQRGAYLTVVMQLTIALSVFVFNLLRHRWMRVVAALVIAGSFSSGAYVLLNTKSHIPLAKSLGLYHDKRPVRKDRARIKMWKRSLIETEDQRWLGSGYGSWMHLHRHIKLPTAHNFWVQTLVEHGIFYMGLVVLLIFLYLYKVFSGVKAWTGHQFRALLFLLAILLISLVQEIDHVNTVYYQIALLAGYFYARPEHAC